MWVSIWLPTGTTSVSKFFQHPSQTGDPMQIVEIDQSSDSRCFIGMYVNRKSTKIPVSNFWRL